MDIKPENFEIAEIQIEQIEIKQEILEDDEDYLFEFKLTEDEYFEIVKELRAKDGDLIEVEQTLIKCDSESCTKMFKNKKLLWKHKKRKHFSPDLVTDEYSICHLCGKNIKMRSYAQHIKNHERNSAEDRVMHRCEFCSREFTRALYLRRHLFVHSDEKPFECSWCGKKLRSEYNLKYHMQRHTGVKEYVCDLCGKETSTRALLDKHLLTHGTNNAFQCNICNRSYRHQSTLSRHSKMHTHICKCQICYQTFRYDSHLRKHLLDIHQDVNGINQPRTSQELVKSKKKPATQIETDQTIVDSNVYYHTHQAPSTMVVNNLANFKTPFGQ